MEGTVFQTIFLAVRNVMGDTHMNEDNEAHWAYLAIISTKYSFSKTCQKVRSSQMDKTRHTLCSLEER